MTLHDFVDQDITLFIKTPLNLYIEVTKTEITEKKDTSKYKEIVQ
jgi:hypothetical protein